MGDTATAVDIVGALLKEWKTGVDAHKPEMVAALFTEGALFQGLQPYSVGRDGVARYYASQPHGMRVTYDILEARLLGNSAALGYVQAQFAFENRPAVALLIGVVATHTDGRWQIAYYQVSPPPLGASKPA
ncbi:SgcJ/EcaC family oxidoreductase [Mycobacterium sp. CBMA271]|uniref:SgcJ/EcaC family oxidoreductase n=1 Tax=unclassified Mycobacteroides TaxID=2618759 RepID=UPI0012DC2595|nr:MULTISPECIES: SgcJ/EcaC family oxidoreductase [unclassified Mycobacteroides]MUM19278.1 hypothetical protein [Mycobacteroides sp. CBMA 326]MUM21690.1 SgcJ/EcaC family oxidoreductase [Mycobacteroides sp. CBMA 271]